MTLRDVASYALWFGTGFAATAWTVLLWANRRHWRAIWYLVLVLASTSGAIILTFILLHRPLTIPEGITTMILIPIMVIPAALALAEWNRSRQVLAVQAERIARAPEPEPEPRRRRKTDRG